MSSLAIYEAIGLATEYGALEGSIDRIKKPKVEIENIAPIVSQTKASQPAENLTIEHTDRLNEKKLNLLSANTIPKSKSPTPNPTSEQRETTSAIKTSSTSKYISKPETYCTYCKRNNYTIEDCRTRRYHERRRAKRAERQIDQQSRATYLDQWLQTRSMKNALKLSPIQHELRVYIWIPVYLKHSLSFYLILDHPVLSYPLDALRRWKLSMM